MPPLALQDMNPADMDGYLQLPFHATWQELKDFVRQVVDVEHVAIFPKSTSGWVKIKGRENFVKAYSTSLHPWCTGLL